MRFVVTLAGSVVFAFVTLSAQTANSQSTKPAAADRPQGSIGTPSVDAVKAAEEAEAAAKEAEEAAIKAATRPVEKRPVAVVKKPRKVARKRPATSIRLKRIIFTPSGYLDDADLQKIAAGFEGNRLKVSSLGIITSAVDALYSEQNIGLAQAILSNVDARSGVVNIELFEARLGQIDFQSKNATAKYLAWRLGLKPGDLADTRLINERLVRLTLSDGLLAEANFLAAEQRGVTNLNIKLQEPGLIGGYIGTDNFGKETTGQYQANFSLVHRSLTGRNDPLEFSGTIAEGTWSAFGSYSAVVTPDGTRLSLSGTAGYSETLTAPVITSFTRQAEVTVQVPFILQSNRRLYGQLSGSVFNETGEIVGAPLIDQQGYLISAGLSGYWSNGNVTLNASQSLRYAKWSDRITPEPDIEHLALFGNALGVFQLNSDYALSVAAGWQATLKGRSPAFYGLTVASQNAVRGYLDSGSKGDSGIFVRSQLERTAPLVLSKTAPSPQQLGAALYPYIFGDIGRAFDYTPAGHIAQDAIASAGVGVSIDFGKSIQANIYVAKPLLDANGVTANGQYAVKFSLNKSF